MAKPERIGGTANYCDGCELAVDAPVVRVGEEPYFESSTAYLCRQCVTKALDELTRPEAALDALEAPARQRGEEP